MNQFALPPAIADLVAARNRLRRHYESSGLSFTLDGNLIREAIAAELFGIRLVPARSTQGIDGYAPDGRSVQVKATGSARGPAFRLIETKADHLLFFDLDLEQALGTVGYNGPEAIATRSLPTHFQGQRSLTRAQIRAADLQVAPEQRLIMKETCILGSRVSPSVDGPARSSEAPPSQPQASLQAPPPVRR